LQQNRVAAYFDDFQIISNVPFYNLSISTFSFSNFSLFQPFSLKILILFTLPLLRANSPHIW